MPASKSVAVTIQLQNIDEIYENIKKILNLNDDQFIRNQPNEPNYQPHITLALAKFPKHDDSNKINAQLNLIREKIQEIATQHLPFNAQIDDLIVLKNVNQPFSANRLVLTLKNQENTTIQQLHSAITTVLQQEKLDLSKFSNKEYLPHISLGIIPYGTNNDLLQIQTRINKQKREILHLLNQKELDNFNLNYLQLSYTATSSPKVISKYFSPTILPAQAQQLACLLQKILDKHFDLSGKVFRKEEGFIQDIHNNHAYLEEFKQIFQQSLPSHFEYNEKDIGVILKKFIQQPEHNDHNLSITRRNYQLCIAVKSRITEENFLAARKTLEKEFHHEFVKTELINMLQDSSTASMPAAIIVKQLANNIIEKLNQSKDLDKISYLAKRLGLNLDATSGKISVTDVKYGNFKRYIIDHINHKNLLGEDKESLFKINKLLNQQTQKPISPINTPINFRDMSNQYTSSSSPFMHTDRIINTGFDRFTKR